MQNVIIDSCVFFGLIKYNKFVEQYGAENLPELIARKQVELDALQQQIETYFDNDFNKKYKNLSFEEKIDRFKEFRNNKIALIEKDIERISYLMQGIVYEKGGEVKHIPITDKRKQELRERLVTLREQLAYYQTEPEIDFNLYKLKKNSILNGKLFQRVLAGDVKLHLFSVSYDEILNHTIPKDGDRAWLCFAPEEVAALTKKYCTLISTHSTKVLEDMQDLATMYRTPVAINGRREMANDINSKGVYGDSLIMAGSNMSGMILLTHNIKDFILDKGHKTHNDYIRQNVKEVSADIQYATDALCYSVEEFLDGKFADPKQINEIYKLQPINGAEQNFTSVFELA